jgi:hypothetical protein
MTRPKVYSIWRIQVSYCRADNIDQTYHEHGADEDSGSGDEHHQAPGRYINLDILVCNVRVGLHAPFHEGCCRHGCGGVFVRYS